jgi:hypothetical protein
VTVPEDTSVEASVPSDNNFLHAIAASERKVLELREELQRAEADLDKLKRQWARHEAQKKREEARRSTKMQPIQTQLAASDKEDDTDGSSAWMQHEMERRKALLNGSRTSNRTVLPGQRHTRTLSLLSPARDPPIASPTAGPRTPRKNSLKSGSQQEVDGIAQSSHVKPLTRASTLSESDNADKSQPASLNLNIMEHNLDQEALLRTGKQMAATFKDGLWTFWEDLRQATVGEDLPQQAQAPRKQNSTQTLKTARQQSGRASRPSSIVSKSSTDRTQGSPSRKKSSAGLPDLASPSFWSEHGVKDATPAPKKKNAPKRIARTPSVERLSAAASEPWDTWDDSPEASRYGSGVTSDSSTLPSTVSASPRTSTARGSPNPNKKEPLPWPVMTKTSGLTTLRRTASNLMKDWEKSLTPSPGEEFTGQEDFLGANAEAMALGAGTPDEKSYKE